jgi:hypothetical protein
VQKVRALGPGLHYKARKKLVANNEDARGGGSGRQKSRTLRPPHPAAAGNHSTTPHALSQTQNKSINQWRERVEKADLSQRLSRPAGFLKEKEREREKDSAVTASAAKIRVMTK